MVTGADSLELIAQKEGDTPAILSKMCDGLSRMYDSTARFFSGIPEYCKRLIDGHDDDPKFMRYV